MSEETTQVRPWRVMLRMLSTALIGSATGSAVVCVFQYASSTGAGGAALAIVTVLCVAVLIGRIADP